MTIFKIIPDDIGIRRIQGSDKQPAITGPVLPVKASNPVQASPEALPLHPLPVDHRRVQRRQFDRRQRNEPVILDTRSPHDRRTKVSRSSDHDEKQTPATLHGVDEEV